MRFRWNSDERAAVELHGVFSIREDLQPDMEGILDIFSDVQKTSRRDIPHQVLIFSEIKKNSAGLSTCTVLSW